MQVEIWHRFKIFTISISRMMTSCNVDERKAQFWRLNLLKCMAVYFIERIATSIFFANQKWNIEQQINLTSWISNPTEVPNEFLLT